MPRLRRVQRGSITIVMHAGTEAWHRWAREYLPDWWFDTAWRLMHPVEVHVYPRRAFDRVHLRAWVTADGERPAPLPPYSCRAWSNPPTRKNRVPSHGVIVLFVDETEEYDSLAWLLLHELGHQAVSAGEFIRYLFAFERDAAGISLDREASQDAVSNDDLHEALPEEQFCNRIATALMGGECYDRRWWRRRVNDKLQRALQQEEAA